MELTRRALIPGLAVAVVSNGKWSDEWVTGEANHDAGTAVTADTVFEACSLSKPVFSWLIFKLIEAGRLPSGYLDKDILLDGRLQKEIGTAPFTGTLTPRMALSHRTGLENKMGNGCSGNFLFEPGTAFSYSGEGYYVVQQDIVETVKSAMLADPLLSAEEKEKQLAGLSLDSLAKEYVFNPLSMSHSAFIRNPDETHASTHDELMHATLPLPKNDSAAGSLHTTAGDYAKFLEACLADDVFFKEAFSPQHQDDIEPGIRWGLGFGLQTTEKMKLAFHWGNGPDTRAFTAINLETRSAVVYMANGANGLSIAGHMSAFLGDCSPILAFLHGRGEYLSCDDPVWIKEHEALSRGALAEEKGDYVSAIAAYSEILSEHGPVTAARIEWLQRRSQPVAVLPDTLGALTGSYFPATFEIREDALFLVFEDRAYRLIPVSDGLFVPEKWGVRDPLMGPLPVAFDFNPVKNQLTSVFKDGFAHTACRLPAKVAVSDVIVAEVQDKATQKVEKPSPPSL